MSDDSRSQARAKLETIQDILDRLDEAREAGQDEEEDDIREEAEALILGVEFRSDWNPDPSRLEPLEFRVLLTVGGPHVEIRGEFDSSGEPDRAKLYHSDWFEELQELQETFLNPSTEETLLSFLHEIGLMVYAPA